MSRIDGISDVVFGFALTLIVASLEVPKTFDELRIVLLGFVPFAICFVFLMVWLAHFRFFRRFGLHDMSTIVINATLLFTMLLILRSEIVDLGAFACCGLLVTIAALLLPAERAMNACFLFAVIGVWKTVSGTYFGRRIRQMHEQMRTREALPAKVLHT